MAKSSLIVLFSLCCLNCYDQPETFEGSGGSDAYSGSGGSVADDLSPPASSTSSGTSSTEHEDDGFDPCPEVTYVLWEVDGIEYTVTLEVFCEPMQNINLGCPGPSEQKN